MQNNKQGLIVFLYDWVENQYKWIFPSIENNFFLSNSSLGDEFTIALDNNNKNNYMKLSGKIVD